MAIAQGFSQVFDDDQVQFAAGLQVYDALHAWCQASQRVRFVAPG